MANDPPRLTPMELARLRDEALRLARDEAERHVQEAEERYQAAAEKRRVAELKELDETERLAYEAAEQKARKHLDEARRSQEIAHAELRAKAVKMVETERKAREKAEQRTLQLLDQTRAGPLPLRRKLRRRRLLNYALYLAFVAGSALLAWWSGRQPVIEIPGMGTLTIPQCHPKLAMALWWSLAAAAGGAAFYWRRFVAISAGAAGAFSAAVAVYMKGKIDEVLGEPGDPMLDETLRSAMEGTVLLTPGVLFLCGMGTLLLIALFWQPAFILKRKPETPVSVAFE